MFSTLSIETCLEKIGSSHPVLFLAVMFASMPILLLVGVAGITTLVGVPLCFFFDLLGLIDLVA